MFFFVLPERLRMAGSCELARLLALNNRTGERENGVGTTFHRWQEPASLFLADSAG